MILAHRFVKRSLDLAIALVLFAPLLPVMLLIALLVRLDTDGPALFAQGRLGLHGTVFRMYKFRTMVQDAERAGTGLFSYHDDPRITRIGRYLRLTSLDELPQIFNVIRGDMSIVGPRPPVTYELDDYGPLSAELKRGFTVKPGITGLAQVSGRNELDWPEKIQYTNEYVRLYEKYGIGIDVVILLRTAAAVVTMKNVIEPRRGA